MEGSKRVGPVKQARSRLCADPTVFVVVLRMCPSDANTHTMVLMIKFQVVRPWNHGHLESWDRYPESDKSFCHMDCCMIRASNKLTEQLIVVHENGR